MLNLIWAGFFILAFVFAASQSLLGGDLDVWNRLVGATFASAKTAFSISLNLTGILCLWLGLL